MIEPKFSPFLSRLSQFLNEQNIPAYMVGGFVRDMLLKRDTADIDIAVSPDALEVAQQVATAFNGKYIPLDRVNGIARVIIPGKEHPLLHGTLELDFSTLYGTIHEDLEGRDFTIDAMAIEMKCFSDSATSPVIIDPFQGQKDLSKGIIRAVKDNIFEMDAARLLRGIRLSHELHFAIESGTETIMRRDSRLIRCVAGERIREELLLLLTSNETEAALHRLNRMGLLTAMIPELALERGVRQPPEHFWDVFEHSLKAVSAADFVLHRGRWQYAGRDSLNFVPWSTELAAHFDTEVSSGSNRRALLKMAAVLHDIAKPQTRAIDSKGRMRFLGHATEGAMMSRDILERLRFSKREIGHIATLVKHHLRPTQLSQSGVLPTKRAIYRFFRDTGENGIDILFLSLADHLATRGPRLKPEGWQEHTQLVDYVLDRRFEQESMPPSKSLLDGNDLISIFHLKPGPLIGKILEMVREAYAAGNIGTREEALRYVRKQLERELKQK
ncbi:MAG: HD domain-containing protein [Dehalococcoidales bacterium]